MKRTLEGHRQNKRWTVRELAKSAGVSTETLSRIARGGRVHFRTQNKIADALGVSPEEIAEFAFENESLDSEPDVIALVRLPAPTDAELAEYERRIERGNREGFFAADPVTGEPTDERVYHQVPTNETPAA